MCDRISLKLCAVSVAGLATFLYPTIAASQTAQDLVGTWQVVAVVNTAKDGTKSDVFGSDLKGMVILAEDGRFVWVVMRAHLPKFASGNRLQGTSDENKAIVQGSQAFFGTYSVADKVLTWHIEGSTWPAWSGTDEKRQIIAFSKDEMTLDNGAAAVTGSNTIVVRRVKQLSN